MVHLMTVQGDASGEMSFETDRMKFVGRGRSLAWPVAMASGGRLSDSEGAVLDPVASIRQAVCIQPNETARIDLVTGVAETREATAALLDKYHDPRLADRVFDLAWTHSNAELHHLNAVEAEAQMYGRLAGAVIYANALYRSSSSILVRNRRGQSGLWGYGISAISSYGLSRTVRKLDLFVSLSSHRTADEGIERRSGDLERRRFSLSPGTARYDLESHRSKF